MQTSMILLSILFTLASRQITEFYLLTWFCNSNESSKKARVIQDVDQYLNLVDTEQDYVSAYTTFWNQKGIEVGQMSDKSLPAYRDIVA